MTWERSFSYCYLFCNCLLTHRENMYLRHFVFIRLLFVFSKCLPTCCSNLITTMVTAKRGQELLTEGCWHARTNSGSAIKEKNRNKIKGITSKYSNKAYELVQRIFISLAICRYRLHRWDFLDKHVCGSRKCREYWYLWMFSLLAFTHSSQPIRQIKASKRLRAICRQIPFSHGVHINCSLNYLQWWKKCVNSKLLPDNSTERSVAQASRAQVHLPAAGGQGLCPSRVCLRPTTALKGTGRTFPLSPADLCNVENLHRPYPAALPLHCSCGGSDMPGQEMPVAASELLQIRLHRNGCNANIQSCSSWKPAVLHHYALHTLRILSAARGVTVRLCHRAENVRGRSRQTAAVQVWCPGKKSVLEGVSETCWRGRCRCAECC